MRFGDGYTPYLVSPQQLSSRRQQVQELAAKAGRALDGFTLACLLTYIPGPSVDDVVEIALNSLRLAGMTPESVRSQYLLGDDDAVVARLQEYVDAGLDHLILGCSPGDDRMIEDFFAASRRLMPVARELRPR